MGTPIWDEVSENIRVIQESTYKRAQIETRQALAAELRNATKKPPAWVVKMIERLERGEIA